MPVTERAKLCVKVHSLMEIYDDLYIFWSCRISQTLQLI
jgi:hypothetical protein